MLSQKEKITELLKNGKESYSVIARELGISRERVRQIANTIKDPSVNKAIKKIRQHYNYKGSNWKKKFSKYKYYCFMGLPMKLRKLVFERDKDICRYCGKHRSEVIRMTVDHVYPKHLKDSSHDIENLVTACVNCNSKKALKILSKEQYAYFKIPIPETIKDDARSI